MKKHLRPLGLQVLFYFCRTPCRHAIIWNIVRDHAASGNDATLPNGNPRANRDIPTDPSVLPYRDREGGLVRNPAGDIVHWVLRRIESAIRTYQDMVANRDVPPV